MQCCVLCVCSVFVLVRVFVFNCVCVARALYSMMLNGCFFFGCVCLCVGFGFNVFVWFRCELLYAIVWCVFVCVACLCVLIVSLFV